MNLDTKCLEVTGKNLNMLVPWYLIAAYAYYVEDNPILSDGVFDSMAKTMLTNYDTITHRHKRLITKDFLKAGTYLGKYPALVIGAYQDLVEGEK